MQLRAICLRPQYFACFDGKSWLYSRAVLFVILDTLQYTLELYEYVMVVVDTNPITYGMNGNG